MIRQPRNRIRLAVDQLDMRQLPAAHITAALVQGVLTVRGTNGADVINVNVGDQQGGVVTVSGVRRTFAAAKVSEVVVLGRRGDDIINVGGPGVSGVVVQIDGGSGNNRITGPPAVAGASAVAPSTVAIPVITTTPVSTVAIPVVTTTATVPAPSPTATTPSASAVNQQIVALINSARASAGLAPLAVSGQLMQEAAIQSTNMVQAGVMSHVLPGSSAPTLADRAAAVGYNFLKIGENIAYNFPDANSVVSAWLASPEHFANIMDPTFTETGVSVAYDATGKAYYTQEFGKPA